MKAIQIFDPAMCCSTGVCGPDVDPELVQIAGFLRQMGECGVKVERYNLSQQPIEFARHAEVKDLLQSEGVEVLPLVFMDGELVLKGSYPSDEMRREWLALAREEK
ncbi:MAG TPA: arsenite efflux transporter metallochaperone ArsD [Chthoniobacterales bacterium]